MRVGMTKHTAVDNILKSHSMRVDDDRENTVPIFEFS